MADRWDITVSPTTGGTRLRFCQGDREVTLTLSDADCETLVEALLERYRDRSGSHGAAAGEEPDLAAMTIDEMLAAMEPADVEAFVAAFDTSDEESTCRQGTTRAACSPLRWRDHQLAMRSATSGGLVLTDGTERGRQKVWPHAGQVVRSSCPLAESGASAAVSRRVTAVARNCTGVARCCRSDARTGHRPGRIRPPATPSSGAGRSGAQPAGCQCVRAARPNWAGTRPPPPARGRSLPPVSREPLWPRGQS